MTPRDFFRHHRTVFALCAALLFGVGVGWGLRAIVVRTSVEEASLLGHPLRDESAPYTYVKPLLACNVGATEESAAYAALKSDLEGIVAARTADGTIERASVFFRNLDTGEWTGVNLDESYTPASLLKVPILLTYLKMAEMDPTLLKQSYSVATDPIDGEVQSIPPSHTVQVGQGYTIEELLKLMILYSDNRATTMLGTLIDKSIRDEMFEDLGIPFYAEGYVISPRIYSRLFRVLYNGTYLNDAYSEVALGWLAQADYADGLRAGIPDDVAIAHKFGNAPVTLADGSAGHELHDCGVVYDDEPYMVCVMTRGKETDRLADVIAQLAGVIHAF